MDVAMTVLVRGRPGLRRLEPSYLAATSLRYQRSKQGVGGDDRAQLSEGCSAHCACLLGEQATLGVGPADALGTKLFAQGAVFSLQVLDDRLLVTVDPSGNGEKEELEVEVPRGGDQRRGEGTGQVLMAHAGRFGGRSGHQAISASCAWALVTPLTLLASVVLLLGSVARGSSS